HIITFSPHFLFIMHPDAMTLLIPQCPLSSWMLFKNKCFLFKGKSNEFRANWSYARSWCREQGGDLAVIDNQYENGNYLRELHYPTWIGLSDLVEENQYAWSDGVSPVLYTNWNENEPNNAGGTNEGCVSMHASPVFHGTWNDTKCDQAKPYICKITFGTSHTD
uniref:C-type lectin domain-containing protein n=1 Tax=Monopterus albus TaxID=43700 RepID=A0A3Q3Q2S8_MONAL